jgi:hypothetical protein
MLNVFGKEESSEGGSNLGVNPKSGQKGSFLVIDRDDMPDW